MAPTATDSKPSTRDEASPLVTVPHTLDQTQLQVGTPNAAGLYIGPAGTAAPTDTKTPWATPWDILGYASDAGPTLAQNTTKQSITPWQSIAPLREVTTAREVTLQFILWQMNDLTLALYFDANPPTMTGGALAMDVRSDQTGHQYAIGIDSKDQNQALRIVFPYAMLSAAGNMPITRGAAVPLDCTVTALENAGVLAHVMLGPAS